ncbi:MAG: carboxypeptidase-like regulatory domain-containing protein [Cytophagia bacterium]|nr:carboxypeptidase-like regulatory domain-containing protein [Cytophagia bacterium]
MRLSLLLCLIAFTLTVEAQVILKGQILDRSSRDPIAFANISFNNGRSGTSTDIEGQFSISLPESYTGDIIISHVAYEKANFSLADFTKNHKLIFLKPIELTLQELTIVAGENPAHALIRNVIDNRDKNNPAKLRSYQYISYNKVVFAPSEADAKTDSIVNALIAIRDTSTLEKKQKELITFDSLARRMNFFMSESVTNKKVLNPGYTEEKLIGLKVSGFNSPLFANVATNFQPFSFYAPYLNILGKDYLNPINPGTFSSYEFHLSDTTFHQQDTVYIIEYTPKANKNFEGLKGFLSIAVDGWAIKNAVAETYDPLAKTKVVIQQHYEKIDSHWFPRQLNTDLDFAELKLSGRTMRLIHRSFLTDIQINTPLKANDFSGNELILEKIDKEESEAIVKQYRSNPLDSLESNTYTTLDTLKELKSILFMEKMLDALITRSIPVGLIELDLNRFLALNEYEGARLGIGLHTSQAFSKTFKLGGYVGYGFRDQAWKYGGDLEVMFQQRKDFKLRLAYKNDLLEAGSSITQSIQNLGTTVRGLLGERFDRIESYSIALHYKLFPGLYLQPSVAYQTLTPQYNYTFNTTEQSLNQFNLAESGISIRYLHKEENLSFMGKRIPLSSNYPILNFTYAKTFDLLDANAFNYNRYSFSGKFVKPIRKLGRSNLILQAHYIDNLAPYNKLFTGFGGKNDSNIETDGYFQTMSVYEFTGDFYAAAFLKHNFGNFFINSRFSKPELVLYHNMGVSSLSSRQQLAQDLGLIPIQSMEQGFFESGLGFNNLIRFNYADVGYMGLGLSAFYRYGDYQLPNSKDNLAFRLSLGFSF